MIGRCVSGVVGSRHQNCLDGVVIISDGIRNGFWVGYGDRGESQGGWFGRRGWYIDKNGLKTAMVTFNGQQMHA